MKITAARVAAAYEFLRQCPPFVNWDLPPTSEVQFGVLSTDRWQADHEALWGRHRIRVSTQKVAHAERLLVVVAHEMVHARQYMLKTPTHHNRQFKRLAREVCNEMGFDPKEF